MACNGDTSSSLIIIIIIIIIITIIKSGPGRISANKLIEGGAAILQELNKNHHIAKLQAARRLATGWTARV